MVATASDDKSIKYWDLADGRVVGAFEGHLGPVSRLSYSVPTRTLWSGSRDLSVRRWGFDATERRRAGEHSLPVTALCCHASKPLVASGSRDTSVAIWDASTLQRLARTQRPRNIVTCMSWIPGSHTLAQGAEDLAVRLWDVREGVVRPTTVLAGYTYFPLALSTHAGGRLIATSSNGFDGVGCELRVWDVRRDASPLHVSHGHEQAATGCAYVYARGDAEKQLIVTGSRDGELRAWEEDGSKCLARTESLEGQAVLCVAPLPAEAGGGCVVTTRQGGVMVVSVAQDGALRVLAHTPASIPVE